MRLASLLLIILVLGCVKGALDTEAKTALTTMTQKDFSVTTNQKEASGFSQQFGRGCEGIGSRMFSSSPMNPGDVGVILPMGLVVDAHVTPSDHQYYSPKEFRSERDKYPVFAPADGFVISIQHRGFFVGDKKTEKETSEYRVFIEYSCTFYSYYDLMTSLSPKLKEAYDKERGNRQSANVRVPVKEGEEIGRIGGQTLDFAVINTNVTLKGFVVPDHYKYESWKIHTADPFDYFEGPLRSQLLALNVRQALPRGGKIDYDIDGKLIGNWFKEGTNGYQGASQQRYWDGHLSFVYDYIDPSQVRISTGDYEDKARQFGTTGPDPSSVDVSSGPVKYELYYYEYVDDAGKTWNGLSYEKIHSRIFREPLGTMIVEMLENRKIRVEAFPGKRASDIQRFTDNAIIYER